MRRRGGRCLRRARRVTRHVNQPQLLLQLPLGARDVAGEPLERRCRVRLERGGRHRHAGALRRARACTSRAEKPLSRRSNSSSSTVAIGSSGPGMQKRVDACCCAPADAATRRAHHAAGDGAAGGARRRTRSARVEGPASDAGKGTIRETDEASTTATAHTRRGRHARAQVRSKGLLSKRKWGRNTALQSQWLTVHQPDRETTSTQVTAAVRVRNRNGQNSFLAFLSQERSSPVPTTLATFFPKT